MPPGAQRYGPVAIAFHWLMVVLVVVVGVLGLLHDSWPDATQDFWINFHAILGLTVWLAVVVRLGWRLTHRPPDLPPDVGELTRRLSYPVHLLLYALMFIVPVVGTLTFLYQGRHFHFGLFQINPHMHHNDAVAGPTETVHGYMAYVLFGLIGLHVLAALWHHFIRRDGILLRIWPVRRAGRGA